MPLMQVSNDGLQAYTITVFTEGSQIVLYAYFYLQF